MPDHEEALAKIIQASGVDDVASALAACVVDSASGLILGGPAAAREHTQPAKSEPGSLIGDR